MKIYELDLNYENYKENIKTTKVVVFCLDKHHSQTNQIFINNNVVYTLFEKQKDNIKNILNNLKKDTLVYLYGKPSEITIFAEYFKEFLTFKYWIAIESNSYYIDELNHKHLGLILFTKGEKLNINTSDNKIPYYQCLKCGKNVKDWGGKKHLMNKKGTAISDVWRHFYDITEKNHSNEVDDVLLYKINPFKLNLEQNNIIPTEIIDQIIKLSDVSKNDILIIKLDNLYDNVLKSLPPVIDGTDLKIEFKYTNKILHGDSIKIMKKLVNEYPDGIFDFIFADPPYNLDKDYENYSDELAATEYIDWCNEWLDLSMQLLKKDGNLFVLNIPKWSIEHSIFLQKKYYLRNWIVWNSMSTPKGKIMPNHYSLLQFSKIEKSKQFSLNDIETIGYCSRISCKNNRTNSFKEQVSDIWSDIHRIKHNKFRDNHPCQLPFDLMKRIVEFSTLPGDLCFDPFSGTGTTSLIANELGRNFFSIDISLDYVNLSINNIKLGTNRETISSTRLTKNKLNKKTVELFVQDMTKKLHRIPTESEFKKAINDVSDEIFNLKNIEKLYNQDLRRALKAGRIVKINLNL